MDSNPATLRWTKRGMGRTVTAVGTPTSLFCEIVGAEESNAAELADPVSALRGAVGRGNMEGDITRFLSSRYLNSGLGINPNYFFNRRRF